jgi:hypothetical protein
MTRKTFLILNLTWGLPMTLIGIVAAIALFIAGKRPERYGDCRCFTVGKGWGGVSLGMTMIVAHGASQSTKNHEHGHAVQNAVYGVLMPFIVGIPSAVRYWYREYMKKIGKGDTLPPYHSIWFEAQASEWGSEYISKWY